MTCAICLDALNPLLDDELLPDEAERVRTHLADCAACAERYRRLAETSRLLRASLMRYEAPDVLKARIRAGLSSVGGDPAVRQTRVSNMRTQWWWALAACVVVAASSSALTAVVMRSREASPAIERQVLDSHIRSLMPGHLTDVASNDQHNVKPWFNGRVNVSPPVPRLDSLGFPIVGGRVDYVDGHAVATTVYTRRQHVINVFSWPSAGTGDAAATRNGYHLIVRHRAGLEFWFVSDLNSAELAEFVNGFERAAAP